MMFYWAGSFLSTTGANKKASNVGHVKAGANVSKVEGTIVNQYITPLFFLTSTFIHALAPAIPLDPDAIVLRTMSEIDGQPGACCSHLCRVRPLWILCTQFFPAFLQEVVSRT
jgi:hypothetical protein